MDCQYVEEYIFDFLTDRSRPDQNHEIKDHVRTCQECRKKVAESKYLLATLDTMKPVKLPKNFSQQVMARINATEKAASSKKVIHHEIVQKLTDLFSKVFCPAPAFVTALVVVALVTLFYQQQFSLTPEKPTPKQNVIQIPTPIHIHVTDIDLGRQKILKAVESSGGTVEHQESLGPDTWRFDIQIPSQFKDNLINFLNNQGLFVDEEKVPSDNNSITIILSVKK